MFLGAWLCVQALSLYFVVSLTCVRHPNQSWTNLMMFFTHLKFIKLITPTVYQPRYFIHSSADVCLHSVIVAFQILLVFTKLFVFSFPLVFLPSFPVTNGSLYSAYSLSSWLLACCQSIACLTTCPLSIACLTTSSLPNPHLPDYLSVTKQFPVFLTPHY